VLALVFTVCGERYALPCRHVVEVVPRVAARAVPHTPAFCLGLIRYRGRSLAVIDLGVLFGGTPSSENLSSRIMVVHAGDAGMVGLLADRVTEAVSLRSEQVERSPIRVAEAEYLGGVFREADGLTQLVEPEHLVPARVRELLSDAARAETGGS
jgi:chemotaxis-related protein WspB